MSEAPAPSFAEETPPHVPSVNSFFDGSSDQVTTVKLTKGDTGFGLRVDVATKGQVQITKVVAHGPADISGKIRVRDLILCVDDLQVGNEQALATPEAVQTHLLAVGEVTLVLGQRPVSTSTGALLQGTQKQVLSSVARVAHAKSPEYEQKLAKALAEGSTVSADQRAGVEEEAQKQQGHHQEDGEQAFADVLTPLLAKLVQGCRSPLLALAKETLPVLHSTGSTVTLEAVSAKISRIAERKCYGAKPKNSSVWENEDDEAMWHWEVHDMQTISLSAVEVRELRSERNKLGAYIRSLVRLCAELRKVNNEARISGEEAKALKAEMHLETERKKQLARKAKEQEKTDLKNAKEEAKKQEKQRKEEEKLRKEDERQKLKDEKQKLTKEKLNDSKSMHMFFSKKPAASASKVAASAPGTNKAEATDTKTQQLDAELRKPKNVVDLRQQVAKWAMEFAGNDNTAEGSRSGETPMKFLHFHENMRPAYYGTSIRMLNQALN
jgi:hypothetical protein